VFPLFLLQQEKEPTQRNLDHPELEHAAVDWLVKIIGIVLNQWKRFSSCL
jgi:hypothetical protein